MAVAANSFISVLSIYSPVIGDKTHLVFD